jgi:radical SAM protein with 4Fe4S-binding SPASM domain
MCGRRKIDKEFPEISLRYGDMDFELAKSISNQLPKNIVVQFHSNGEGLLYPRFGEVVSLFKNQIKCLTTNGDLIVEKAYEIIGKLDTISISIIEDDTQKERGEQLQTIKKFLEIKGNDKPFTIFRILGNVDDSLYKDLNGLIVKRTLHSPLGSFDYKKPVTIPETGICWDFLNHPCINRDGDVSICVRFDPHKLGVIGNIKTETLEKIWNGELRMKYLERHRQGRRKLVPLCSKCEYWGVPTSS